MEVFLINLEQDSEKRRFMLEQLTRFNISFSFVSAINGKIISETDKHKAVNRFRWWCAIGLPARDAEIGCALSHYGIYKKLVEANEQAPVCILEDDVVLDEMFPKALKFIAQKMDMSRPQVVLLSDHMNQYATENGELKASGGQVLNRSRAAMCTDAYVINALAAAAILNENLPMKTPCDHWWRWARKGVIELYHYLPSVAMQDQETFGTSTQNGIVPVHEWPLLKWVWFKFKRVFGKTLDMILK